MWSCPSCKSPLYLHQPNSNSQRVLRCDNGHSFDVAKEGHVNLLLAQHKNSRDPGDNKQMVAARRRFLDSGAYRPLAMKLADIIVQHCQHTELNLYDAGCGEGYYLGQISQTLSTAGKTITAAGNDIAKFAVQKAAKRYPDANFAVASSFDLPVADGSQDVVIQIFAPADENQVLRVLKSRGLWIQVNPVAKHLWQLKQALYDTPLKFDTPKRAENAELMQQQVLGFDIDLEEQSLREDLLMMTPYYWSTPQAKKQAVIDAMQHLSIEFEISIYQNKPA
ncbi:putative RNA methyltransferase [Neptunicella marina]|uniref:Methyltransferase domain-containing protein n=1 Tax=Neptunicella marina TaxID=2125989 RepID=A0A8J6IQJ2_9ALTE|nr:methyltransferase domain-containing protein [Neptunicella marina]MBC3764609.1 methyltransferase domain-containing protein [Neptunicella marina]